MKLVLERLLQGAVGLLSIFFIVLGIRWLVDPSASAIGLGLAPQVGLGLSSQVGDLSAFFLVTGLGILFGLASGNRLWYYPSVMLLLAAAIGRTIAWLFHDAAFAPLLIATEIGVGLLLVFASKTLPKRQ